MNRDIEFEFYQLNLKEILIILSLKLNDRELEFMAFRLGLLIDRKFSDDELQTKYIELLIQGVIRSHSFEETAIRYGYTLVKTKSIATRIDRKMRMLFRRKIRSAKFRAFLEG